MSTIVIDNLRPSYVTLATGERLIPGKNTIPLESYEKIKDMPTFKSWIKVKYLKVLKEDGASVSAKSKKKVTDGPI